MNKFTASIIRLDYDEPVSLTDVLRITPLDPLLKDFAGVCGITHGMANPPDDVSADRVMYAGILETIVEKMESI